MQIDTPVNQNIYPETACPVMSKPPPLKKLKQSSIIDSFKRQTNIEKSTTDPKGTDHHTGKRPRSPNSDDEIVCIPGMAINI